MITEVNAVTFRQNLGEMLNQVQYRNDSIVINKDGKPVAALVDAELFARIRRMRDRFDALSNQIAEAYAGVPVEEGLAEIDYIVTRERACCCRACGWCWIPMFSFRDWHIREAFRGASLVFGVRVGLMWCCRGTFWMRWSVCCRVCPESI